MKPYILKKPLNRMTEFYEKDSPEIPKALFEAENIKPDLSNFPYPLPSKKKDYTCFVRCDDGVIWYGAETGLTRYDRNAEREDDIIMYFSAERYLFDNKVEHLLADGNTVWVLTEKGVVHISMVSMTAREKADLLLKETEETVMRRGMVSQRELKKARDLSSKYPDNESDNDGCFTAVFAMGEMFRYETLKRELGENHPDTVRARKVAVKSIEACLLLMYIHGRGDGFVARTYLLPDERVPGGGLFFRRWGDTATCYENNTVKERNLSGKQVYCGAEIPERLAKLYRDLGYTEDGIVYKGDTSSDEITTHFIMLRYAHEIIGKDDKELDDLIKKSSMRTAKFIIDRGFVLTDFLGKPTTWARWDEDYFNTPLGWSDATLNAAEMLYIIKSTMYINDGKDEYLQNAYDRLIERGYADLATKHYERYYLSAMSGELDMREDLMFGDHMLAVISYWGLCDLETDEKLKEKFKTGFEKWRTTLAKEHNPGYDFPYALACGKEINMDFIARWFYRFNTSRLASRITCERKDYPVSAKWGGNFKELSALLPPDECFIAKYDRNPMQLCNEDSGGKMFVESCYVYTFAYWMGRYFGFIKEEEDEQ